MLYCDVHGVIIKSGGELRRLTHSEPQSSQQYCLNNIINALGILVKT